MAQLTHGTSPRSIDCQWSRHILCLTPSTCDCRCHAEPRYLLTDKGRRDLRNAELFEAPHS